MKLWQGVISIMVLLAIIPLSGCDYLGRGSQQQAYEEQLKAYQEYNKQLKAYREQQQEYQRKVVEAYNEQLPNVYKEYSEGLNQYYEDRQKTIEEALVQSENITQSENQTR